MIIHLLALVHETNQRNLSTTYPFSDIIVVGGLGECQEISENTKKKSKTKFHQNQNHFHSKNEDSCSRKVEILPLPTNDDFDKAIDGNLAQWVKNGEIQCNK